MSNRMVSTMDFRLGPAHRLRTTSSFAHFTRFSCCPSLVCLYKQSSTYSSLHGAEVWRALLFNADIGMLPVCFEGLASFTTSAWAQHAQYSDAPTALLLVASLARLVSYVHTQLLPVCVCFNVCCSLITSASVLATSPHLHRQLLLLLMITHTQYKVQRSHITSLVLPHGHPTSITHTHAHTHTKKS